MPNMSASEFMHHLVTLLPWREESTQVAAREFVTAEYPPDPEPDAESDAGVIGADGKPVAKKTTGKA